MINKNTDSLAREASMILGNEALGELEDWYRYTLRGEWRYVVYIVRRSYVLALIMEQITGCKMEEDCDVSYITDAAFLLCCEDLAEYYQRYCHFPPVLLCDDLLIHGRNVNNIILDVERRLCQLLPEEDESTIKEALALAVSIHVYVRADTALLLESRYWLRLEYTHLQHASDWRGLASDLSMLVIRSNIANTAYINSEFITPHEFEKVEKSEYRRIVYQNNVEYINSYFSCMGGMVKAICTLRIVEDRYGNGYRVIPFVFLPNLDEEETQALFGQIYRQLRRSELDPSFLDMLRRLEGIIGKRSINEWITMLLSNVLLQEFNGRFHINILKEDQSQEIEKLARNYRFQDFEHTKKYLKQCIEIPLYPSVEQMEESLFFSGLYDRFIMQMDRKGVYRIAEKQIRHKVERYFYEHGRSEELAAIRFDAYFDSRRKVGGRRSRGSCFVIKELFEGLALDDMKLGMAYFVHAMDAGVSTLSSFAAPNVNVVGFAQFAKVGEQSLYIEPLKYIEYLSCLARIYNWCDISGLEFEEYFRDYVKSDKSDINIKEGEKLLRFVRELEKMGQTPIDWDANYMPKYDFGEDRNRFSEVVQLFGKQQEHLDTFELYRNTQG